MLLEDLDHLVLIVGRQTSVANAVESVESVESVSLRRCCWRSKLGRLRIVDVSALV